MDAVLQIRIFPQDPNPFWIRNPKKTIFLIQIVLTPDMDSYEKILSDSYQDGPGSESQMQLIRNPAPRPERRIRVRIQSSRKTRIRQRKKSGSGFDPVKNNGSNPVLRHKMKLLHLNS